MMSGICLFWINVKLYLITYPTHKQISTIVGIQKLCKNVKPIVVTLIYNLNLKLNHELI